ncbi:MAG: PQQ-dependent sugar dehydrogenase, partial [Planctomycetota bacterium]|nr:PQQ-dependent sugar dehydrogenase [Planctomycetota bacterium]
QRFVRLSRFQVTGGDPNQADPNSEVVLFTVAQPYANHNGGCIRIGSHDLKLYVGLGDGGLGNDPRNRAQDGQSLFGKILRLELDGSIPPDNPFVGHPAIRDEVWALGLRNPWRFSFDRETHDLWIADVGQSNREEIDFEPAGEGRHNYGWRCMEGSHCTGLGGCACGGPAVTQPVFEYSHAEGCAVIGGHRYRGQEIPALEGRYVFGDFCAGRVWSIAFDGASASDLVEHTTDLGLPPPTSILTFGEDGAGELYVGAFSSDGPGVWRIVPGCAGDSQHFCDTAPNSAGPGASMASNQETSISANLFEIRAWGAVPGESGLFFYGPNEIQLPFGEGFRCVGGPIFRLDPPAPVGSGGQIVRPVDMTAPPAGLGPGLIEPGDTWKFQLWYRDPGGGPAGFNLSDGLSVDFCP